MRVATVISLGASALLGVGALLVARVWLPGASPETGGAPARVSAQTPVVVAALPLAYGVKLEAKHLAVARMPADAAPVGAFSSVDQVLNQAGGSPVVLAALTAKEPLLPHKISGPGARPSVAAAINPGMRAYTIRVSDVAGVGGHVLPGDRVDVILTRDLSNDNEVQKFVSDIVTQNVRVLGIDLNADPTSTTAAVPKTATLEVLVEDAQRLAVASDLGDLSLALRRAGSAEAAPMRRVVANELGSGPNPSLPPMVRVQADVRAQPAAPARAAPAPRPAAPHGRRLVVVHGDNVSEVTVASGAGA